MLQSLKYRFCDGLLSIMPVWIQGLLLNDRISESVSHPTYGSPHEDVCYLFSYHLQLLLQQPYMDKSARFKAVCRNIQNPSALFTEAGLLLRLLLVLLGRQRVLRDG